MAGTADTVRSTAGALRERLDPKDMARKGLKGLSALTDRVGEPLQGPRILIYHQVDAGNGQEMDIGGDDFEKQMRWLASTGAVRPLEDVLANLDSTEPAYVITFDDGYTDMYENGFPLLRELGLPFTLYLTTAPMETGRPLREDGFSAPCTWDQVEEMVGSGLVTMGAHTHTHADLRHISEDEIEHEVGTSNQIIEQRTGLKAQHFTYPWGYWTEAADRVMRRHYRSATVAGCETTRFASPFAIPRLPIQLSDGWAFFRPRLRGGFRLEDVVRRRVSGYEGP
jgi:peptidoglycan/xylan/chitin deacetylase (PgdA/CDA1 family)